MMLVDKRSARGAVVLAATLVAASAHAQSDSGAATARPFAIKLGAFTPSSRNARQFSGATHVLLDASYEFKKASDSSFRFAGYFDYFFPTSRTEHLTYAANDGRPAGFEDDTGRASAYGIGVQARYLLPASGHSASHRSVQPYVGGGLGLYESYGKFNLFGSSDGADYADSYSHTVAALGGKVMVGIESHSGLLGEINYNALPKNQDLDLSGYGFQIGYRF